MTLQQNAPAFIWKRVTAGIFDYAVIWVLLWIPLRMALFGDADNEIEFQRNKVGAYLLFMGIMGIWLFPFCLRDLVRGKSLGKWLVGIRVVDAADASSTPTAKKLILRNLTIWFSPVGMVSAYMSPDKMRFGDRFAGTMVVDDPPPPGTSPWKRWLPKAAVAVLVILCLWPWWNFTKIAYVRQSRLFAEAKTFVDGYAPLAEVAGPLQSSEMIATGDWIPTDNGAKAYLFWSRKGKDCTAGGLVLMDRLVPKASPWKVTDALGEVILNPGQEGKERRFVYWLKKDLHRFVTDEEFRKVFKEQKPYAEVLPELKVTPDNAPKPNPAPPEKATPDNAPRPHPVSPDNATKPAVPPPAGKGG